MAFLKPGNQSRKWVIDGVKFPFVINPCTNINELMGKIHPDERPDNVLSGCFEPFEKLSVYIEYDELRHAIVVLKGVAMNEHLLNIIYERKEEYLPGKILSAMTKAKDPLDVLRGNFTSTFFREAETKNGKRVSAHTYGKIVGWGRYIRSVKVKEQNKDGKATGKFLADTTEYEMRDYDPFDEDDYKKNNKGTVPTLFKMRLPKSDKFVSMWPMRTDGGLFPKYKTNSDGSRTLLNPIMTVRGQSRYRNIGPQDLNPGSEGKVVVDLQGINFGDSLAAKPVVTSISFERGKPKPKLVIAGEVDASVEEMRAAAEVEEDGGEGEDADGERGEAAPADETPAAVSASVSASASAPSFDDFDDAERTTAAVTTVEATVASSESPSVSVVIAAAEMEVEAEAGTEDAAALAGAKRRRDRDEDGSAVALTSASGSGSGLVSVSGLDTSKLKEKKGTKKTRHDASAAAAATTAGTASVGLTAEGEVEETSW